VSFCPAAPSSVPASKHRRLWGTQPNGEVTGAGFGKIPSRKQVRCMHILWKKRWRPWHPYVGTCWQTSTALFCSHSSRETSPCLPQRDRGLSDSSCYQQRSQAVPAGITFQCQALQGPIVLIHRPYHLSPFQPRSSKHRNVVFGMPADVFSELFPSSCQQCLCHAHLYLQPLPFTCPTPPRRAGNKSGSWCGRAGSNLKFLPAVGM